MAYRIAFMRLTPDRRRKTVEREIAIEAWALVQHLDEFAETIDRSNSVIVILSRDNNGMA